MLWVERGCLGLVVHGSALGSHVLGAVLSRDGCKDAEHPKRRWVGLFCVMGLGCLLCLGLGDVAEVESFLSHGSTPKPGSRPLGATGHSQEQSLFAEMEQEHEQAGRLGHTARVSASSKRSSQGGAFDPGASVGQCNPQIPTLKGPQRLAGSFKLLFETSELRGYTRKPRI